MDNPAPNPKPQAPASGPGYTIGGSPHLVNCPKCRNPISLDTKVCLSCGQNVAEYMANLRK